MAMVFSPFTAIRDFRLPIGQVMLELGVLCIGSTLLLITIPYPFPTLLLFWFISLFGLFLCHYAQIRLGDAKLKALGYLWLIKLGITFFLLYVAWIPNLEYYLIHGTGYDPIRYYWLAQELVTKEWVADFVSLNYVGILYYYGTVFFLFGHNPIAPALVNVLVTLIASLFLIRICYEIKPYRSHRDWTLAFVLLVPEILWFDLMTAREMLLGALLLFAMLATGRYFAETSSVSLSRTVVIVGICALIIAAVRTSMIVPLTIAIVFMGLLVKPQVKRRTIGKMVFVALAIVVILTVPAITAYLGGYNFEIVEVLHRATNATENILTRGDLNWSEDSIGLLLMPNGVLQSILYLPPRMVLYLVAPIPNVHISVSGLLSGNYIAWQHLLLGLTSLLNIMIFPYVLASLYSSIRSWHKNQKPLMLHIAYWTTFVAIAGGNLIIHPRYRVMAILLLIGCAWFGTRTCSKKLIFQTSLLWYGTLIACALFYVGYKLL